MATIRLKHVTRDRSEGVVRYYLRLPGKPKQRLPGKPGDPVFMSAYQAAMANVPPPRRPDGSIAKKDAHGTLQWLVDEYIRSANFKGLAAATQGARHNILKVVLRTAAEVRVSAITPEVVREGRDRRAATPNAANSFLKAMRHLFDFAVEYDHAKVNPARGIKGMTARSDGHHTWTIEEVEVFEAAYPLGTTARLCFSIMLFTGLRVSDAAVLGRQHIRDGWVTIRMQKGGKSVSVPVLPPLQAAIDAMPASSRQDLTLLINGWGKPFSVKGLGQRMSKWCDQVGLPECTSHGLRKAGATIAAENGATEHQLMAIYGWSSPKQAAIYTRAASRRRLAGEAAHKINPRGETANEIVPPLSPIPDRRDKSA